MIKCLKEGSYAATCAFKTLGYAVNNHSYNFLFVSPLEFALLGGITGLLALDL